MFASVEAQTKVYFMCTDVLRLSNKLASITNMQSVHFCDVLCIWFPLDCNSLVSYMNKNTLIFNRVPKPFEHWIDQFFNIMQMIKYVFSNYRPRNGYLLFTDFPWWCYIKWILLWTVWLATNLDHWFLNTWYTSWLSTQMCSYRKVLHLEKNKSWWNSCKEI